MDVATSAILVQDGITNGAIYALLALALVLVFSVTRIIFIPQGEFVALGALSLAAIQSGRFPQSATLLLALGILTFARELLAIARSPDLGGGRARAILGAVVRCVAPPAAVFLLARAVPGTALPLPAQVVLALAIVVPMGSMVYRLAFQPLADASTLVLLIVAVAVHFALLGLCLLMFGAEGFRTTSFSEARMALGPFTISGQSLVIVGSAGALIVVLYGYFERTLAGKALRATAVNRIGARLSGIGTTQAGRVALTVAASIGALCGVLIAPQVTVYYDSGFLIGLKGFVGAIIGGLASYPVAAAGAIVVGLLESYSSFWASALKDVIVFALIVPVLVWRSLATTPVEEEGDP
jgi:branched-chain amino acid transport system permease protein